MGYITLTGYRVSAAKMYLYHGSKIAKLDHIEQKFHKNYENLQKWNFLKTLLLSWKYHAQKKRPKICTGFRVNAAKIYLQGVSKVFRHLKWAVCGELVHLKIFLRKYQMKKSIIPTLSENFDEINQTWH